MTISLEHFSFNKMLQFKFPDSADSSKTASSQTNSASLVSVSTSTSSNDSQSSSTSAVILTDDTEDQDKLVEETPCALQLLKTLWLVETFKTSWNLKKQ